jgi:hypothetical protein
MNVSFPPFAVGWCLFAVTGWAKANAASAMAPAARSGSANKRFM